VNAANESRARETGFLQVRGLLKRFGGITAVNGLDMTVRGGDIHALIGPNGSGKTTTLNVISGSTVPTADRSRFDGSPSSCAGRRTPSRKLGSRAHVPKHPPVRRLSACSRT
jgi:branched-chain amino acid transport system ATP-binding protein